MTDEPERPSDWHIAYSAWLPDAIKHGTITTNDAFRAGYLAAIAETGWRDIRDAPDICPEHGGSVGCWSDGQWCDFGMGEGMRFGSKAERGYTHFFLNPCPPPKPGSGQ